MSVPGRHMALNALGALLAAMEVGAPAEAVLDGLGRLRGSAPPLRVGRHRARRAGSFDDYAHHPTEVRATLGAVRTLAEQSGSGRSVVVFQPHLYSRTAAFAHEFGQALMHADEVFVLGRLRGAGAADGRYQRRNGGRARQQARCTTSRTSRVAGWWPTRRDPAMSS
jgi:UDP-N-acetylmuramate--alanine ligase